jgi:hypothetical protein
VILPKLIKYSSEHYNFHFVKDSLAEIDINKIACIQEKCYKEISSFLNVFPTFKIDYFLLDTPELVGEIYGDNDPCNGFANPPNEIYAVYNEKVKCIGYHEDAHIISYILNKPQSVFLREGLAMYFDKVWWNKSNDEWVRLLIKSDRYLSIRDLIQNDYFLNHTDEITYPIAGAFVKYLINRHGRELFVSVYAFKGYDLLGEIESKYATKIEDIENDFLDSILLPNIK